MHDEMDYEGFETQSFGSLIGSAIFKIAPDHTSEYIVARAIETYIRITLALDNAEVCNDCLDNEVRSGVETYMMEKSLA